MLLPTVEEFSLPAVRLVRTRNRRRWPSRVAGYDFELRGSLRSHFGGVRALAFHNADALVVSVFPASAAHPSSATGAGSRSPPPPHLRYGPRGPMRAAEWDAQVVHKARVQGSEDGTLKEWNLASFSRSSGHTPTDMEPIFTYR